MNCMTCDKPKPANSIKRCDECIRIANKLNVQHHRQLTAEIASNREFSVLMNKWIVV